MADNIYLSVTETTCDEILVIEDLEMGNFLFYLSQLCNRNMAVNVSQRFEG